jgi:competence protein ComEC
MGVMSASSSSTAEQAPSGQNVADYVAAQHLWLKRLGMSSIAARAEHFLNDAGFDRGPWFTVAFAFGIGAWFAIKEPWQWVAFITLSLLLAIGSVGLWRGNAGRTALMMAVSAVLLALAAGTATIWTRSAMVGAEPIPFNRVSQLDARILEREEQPSQGRTRLTLAVRDETADRAIKVRVNLSQEQVIDGLSEGARIRLRARLVPPSSPILPGAYNFARAAWFDGLAATGSALGEVELVERGRDAGTLAAAQRWISAHVQARLEGAAGTIAAAFASGDRGAISARDAAMMRDAGLTHLLAISGLHVSAVIAGGYFVAIKLLALWPWLVLRVRLPLAAAIFAAACGVGYTLLTGAQIPTVRACFAAMLVLVALAIGREPLSLRMVAAAALFVLMLWPESLVGPSFQMSFAAVTVIIALHNTKWAKDFLTVRDEPYAKRFSRRVIMLFLTGLAIEIALMPIVLFHFHRAGFYGAFANVLAIPLVTFVAMPMIALALFLDLLGLGAPIWWIAGQSLDLLLAIAYFTAQQPGAVKLSPEITQAPALLFVFGALWLALWRGKARGWGLIPCAAATAMMLSVPTPDVLITRDGHHVAITGEREGLLLLRNGKSSFARDNLLELAGSDNNTIALEDWPAARCSPDFCVINVRREGRDTVLLLSRSERYVDEDDLAKACAEADVVVSDRFLPKYCRPKWIRADRNFLRREGGLALFLSGDDPHMRSVRQSEGKHGWWRGR